jgi:thymidine kinase
MSNDIDIIAIQSDYITEIKSSKHNGAEIYSESDNKLIDFTKNINSDFEILMRRDIDKEMYLRDGIWNVKFSESKRSRMIFGTMQSGKTSLIIATAIYYSRYNIPVFVILQNSDDARSQFFNRINTQIASFNGIVNNKTTVKQKKGLSKKEFRRSSAGNSQLITVLLRNSTDIGFCNEMIEGSDPRYILIIDESDFTDSGKECACDIEIEKLKENASVIWNVSATPMVTLMKETIACKKVYITQKPAGYKDLFNIEYNDLPLTCEHSNNADDDPLEKDENISSYLLNFEKTEPFFISIRNQSHPNISLMRVGRVIEPQQKVAMWISENTPNITVATFNGGENGITLRGKGIGKYSIVLSNGVSSVVSKINGKYVHKFRNTHISFILEFMQEYGVDRFPRIVILAGQLADRGISFSASHYTTCEENNEVPWHLTEMYYTLSDSSCQPTILQTAGRLCGIYKDDIPLKMYTNGRPDIIKAYTCQEELIARSKSHENEKVMKYALESTPISKHKCSVRRYTPAHIRSVIKKVEDDCSAGGWDWTTISNCREFCDEKKANEKEIISQLHDLRIKKVLVSYKRGGLLKKIIDLFLSNDNTPLSERSLQKTIGSEFELSNFTRWGKHHQYKIIERAVPSSKYSLTKEILLLKFD